MACGAPLASAAETVPPVLGQTIVVTGASPADAAPTACTAGVTVSCANLRSAIAHANTNDNGTADAPKYDRIVLDNGSTHTLTVTGAGEGAAATGDLDILSHITIETANPLDYANKATIAGGTGFGDRLLDINSPPTGVIPAAAVIVKLNNLVLTKGQGVYMNGGAIYANDGASLTITRSTITDNFASWDGDFDDPADPADTFTNEVQGSGGGIYSKGALNISFSTLSKNTAKTVVGTLEYQKNGNGGAIYASQAATISDSTIGGEGAGNAAVNGGGLQMAGGNKLQVERTTFSYNDAISGGGINVVSPSAQPFTITNSTFSANHVTDSGAGINTNSSVTILNTTIANNVKDSSNKGSGLNMVGGSATLKNTLLANNLGGGVSANCGMVGSGTLPVVSGGGNLATDGTCNLTLASDQQNVADALIGPLALNDNTLNGTLTHALLTGSPAVDKGVTDGCPSGDQRGSVRPFDALVIGTKVCDIGAYEVWIDRKDLAITSMIATPTRVEVNQDSTITLTVLNTATATATGVVLTGTLPSGATLTSGTFNGGTCNGSGTTVTCSLPDLTPAGLPLTVTLVVKVASAGENVVSATVTSDAIDPVESNNTASVSLLGLTNADLNLTATAAAFETAAQGTVTLNILNQGAGDARNVVLTGSVPDGVTLVSVSDVALCSTSGSAFTCTIPEILANASRAITLTVSSAVAGSYTATASVTGDIVDADATDNSVSATITVSAPVVVVAPDDGDDGGGGGCTMGNGRAPFDPTLPLLAGLGLAGLGLRRIGARRR
jgi:uncharacterized repeat protein (TIGR01451 family)